MKKKKVAIFTGPQGHYSIAKAIEETIKNKYQVNLFYDRSFIFNFYTPFYQLFPRMASLPFFLSHKLLSHHEKTNKLALDYFRFQYRRKIENFTEKQKPDACISTFFMFNPSLEKIQTTKKIPLINIISDPRTVHRLTISDRAKINISFDKQTSNDIKKISPNCNVKGLGWFVSDKFSQKYDQDKLRKALQLKPEYFTILIASGSDGTNMILKILPSILLSKKKLQVIVACGNNKNLKKAINSLKIFTKQRPKNNVDLIPIGFTNEIYKYMQAADLVVGKAGPNTLFESVATRTPFFAITHIAGQEDGNLEIIKKYKLGFVEERPIQASQLLKKIINDPKMLDAYTKPIEKMAKRNEQAKVKLLTLLEKLIDEG